jgi:hypothetical protein
VKSLVCILLLLGHVSYAVGADLEDEFKTDDPAATELSLEEPLLNPAQTQTETKPFRPDKSPTDSDDLRLSELLSRPPGTTAIDRSNVQSSGKRLHIGVGASYSTSSRAKFDPVVYSNGMIPEKTTLEINFSEAVAVEAEIRYLNKNSVGFILGAIMDQERHAITGKLSSKTIVYTTVADFDFKLQVSTYYLSAAFRADDFYFPIGANFSSAQASADTSIFGTVSASGGLGWQLGLGYYVTDYFILEFLSRKATLNLTGTFPDGSTVDFGKGGLTNLLFTAKFIY